MEEKNKPFQENIIISNTETQKDKNNGELNDIKNNNPTNKADNIDSESKMSENGKIPAKINSVPNEMRCFLCEDYCEDPVQIVCCNEVFCKKHITEEIIRKFACPKCNKKSTLNDIIENKKLAEDIQWFKQLLKENI